MNKTNKKSTETIVNDLLQEVESLRSRMRNIKETYMQSSNTVLRFRLREENNTLINRFNTIYSIAKSLEKRSNEVLSFSNLLLEICRRTLLEIKLKRNLYFL